MASTAALVAAVAVWGVGSGGGRPSFAEGPALPSLGPERPPDQDGPMGRGMDAMPPPPEPEPEPAFVPSAEAQAIAPEDRPRLVALARMEGAAIDAGEAAAALRATATQITSTGRLTGLVALRSDSTELHRRVESMALAAKVLVEVQVEAPK